VTKTSCGLSITLFHLTSMLLVAFLTLAALASRSAQAQTTAVLSGTVYDPTGAAIPGAAVTLRNQTTAAERQTVSNGSGFFSFPAVVPGTYTIHIETAGFQAWQRTDIIMNPGDQRNIPDIHLTLGSQAQEISVSANTSAVPVDNGERSTVLSNTDITRLSTVGRDATELLKILPGSAVLTGVGNTPYYTGTQAGIGNSGVGNYSINGVQPEGGVAEILDGASIIDPGVMGANTQSLNTDMIDQVTIQTSNFGADSPKGPVVVNAVSKYGTVNFHGEGYLYARNSAMNANSWENDAFGQPIVPAHYYYPGANIGGPVLIPGLTRFNRSKKLFFWTGFEYYNQQQAGNGGNPLESYVPTAGMRTGNFSPASIAGLCPSGYSDAQQYCLQPAGVTPGGASIVGGMIPQSAIDPGAAAMMNFIPAANAVASGPGGYDYIKPYSETYDGWQFHARVDYNLSDMDRLYFTYNRQIETDTEHVNKYWVGGNMVEYPSPLDANDTSDTGTVNYTHVFGPNLTNEVLASMVYFNQPSQFANPQAIERSTYQFPSSYTGFFNNGTTQMPGVNNYGASAGLGYIVMEGGFESGPVFSKKVAPNFGDNLTWIKRTHSIKVGFYWEHTGNEQTATGVATNGQYSFGNTGTWLINGQQYAGTGNSVANALLGLTTGYTQQNFAPVTDLFYRTFSFYAQDAWKVTPRLTLTYGVRFEHLGPWIDNHGEGMAIFDPALYNANSAAGTLTGLEWHGIDPSVPMSGVYDNPSFFTSPRFGVAYDLLGNGNTVLRGGIGLYRFQDQYNYFAGAVEEGQGAISLSTPSYPYLTMAQIQSYQPASPTGTVTPGSLGAVYVMDPRDNNRALTTAYNFTVTQRIPGNSTIELAYVGNKSDHLINDGTNGNVSNINLIPPGAFFQPDPVTGAAASPATANSNDYRPYNAYQQIYQISNNLWSNYNAFQASWTKQAGRLTFNLNYTFSKALGINTANDPFNFNNDYGPLGFDRTHILNLSYAYSVGQWLHGNTLLKGLANGWTISGITTWQSGLALQTNGLTSANFGLTCINCSNTAPLDSAYYLGTTDLSLQPLVTCNPGSSLGPHQYASASCFAVPSPGENGPVEMPAYLRSPAFFNMDLSTFKDFHITERQRIQFRFDAFNFLNHPLDSFTSTTNLALQYTENAGAFTQSNALFGIANQKANNRVLEVAAKYVF